MDGQRDRARGYGLCTKKAKKQTSQRNCSSASERGKIEENEAVNNVFMCVSIPAMGAFNNHLEECKRRRNGSKGDGKSMWDGRVTGPCGGDQQQKR